MHIEVSKEVADLLEELAEDEETTKREIVRSAFSIMKVYKDQRQEGLKHIGFTADPEALQTEIVGILNK